VLCNGGNTGSASARVTGGGGSYTYSWAPSGGTAALASGLIAGSYTLTVIDSIGDTLISKVSITQPQALVLVGSSSDISCFGSASGSASVAVTGGTGNYTYTWTGVNGTTSSESGLLAGAYSVKVTDANGCTSTQAFTLAESSAALSVSSTQNNFSCFGSGGWTAKMIPSGGTAGYSYSWGPSGSFGPSGGTGAQVSGSSVGTYTCTVTDSKGCTVSSSVIITEPAALTGSTSSIAVSCNGGADGAASASLSGGIAPYTYYWSEGLSGSTSQVSGLGAGSYTVTVFDANECILDLTGSITQPDPLIATPDPTNPFCHGGINGSVSVSASGGTSPYSYLWSAGSQTSVTINDLTSGSYSVTVTDSKGCSVAAIAAVSQPADLQVSIATTSPLCYGSSTGSAVASATGGNLLYNYSWKPVGGTAVTASNLASGTYSCTVTDDKGCTASSSALVSTPGELSVAVMATTAPACGSSNGSITVIALGGTGPSYEYTWSPGGASGATDANLSAGTYSVTATDANGCTSTGSSSISNPTGPAVSGSVTGSGCPGQSNGAINASISGGTSPYTYSWSTGASSVTSSLSGSIGSLDAGNYVLEVTDASQCIGIQDYSVNSFSVMNLNAEVTNVSCFGLSSGAAVVTVTSGVPSFAFSWAPGGLTSASGSAFTVSGLSAGSYSVTVTDGNSCTQTTSVAVGQPAFALSATGSSTPLTCNGNSSGTASVSAGGGTSPYNFIWTGGSVSSTDIDLAAGTYTCTVTDVNACSATQVVVVNQPNPLTISAGVITSSGCAGLSNGVINPAVTGGTGAYSYSWSNGVSGMTSSALGFQVSGLNAGSYTLNITDANGCSSNEPYSVNPLPLPVASVSVTAAKCNGTSTGSANVSVSSGTPVFDFRWSNGVTGSSGGGDLFTGMSAGSYTVTVNDANGCSATAATAISQPGALITQLSSTNILCNGQSSGSAGVNVSGGTPLYTYKWSNGVSGVSGLGLGFSGFGVGSYTVTVSDANGCSGIQSATMTQPPALFISAGTVTDAGCFGQTNGAVHPTVAGGTGTYSYSWSNGFSGLTGSGSGMSVSGLGAGNYTLTVTDANSCTDTQLYAVASFSLTPVSLIFKGADTLCTGVNSTLSQGSPSGGIYSGTGVSGSQFNSSLANMGYNTVTYTYTDGNSCVNSASDSIFVNICTYASPIAFSGGIEITVYPNPSQGIFTVDLTELNNANALVRMVNVLGQEILRTVTSESRPMYNLREWPAGLYYLSVQSGCFEKTLILSLQ